MDQPLRIAHLTATFPPYRGGAGNTADRFARGQAERGHHVEVFTATQPGPLPDPGKAIVHRLKPVFAIGNAPLIPSLARLEGFDLLHIHYPFIFGSDLTLLGRLTRKRRRQALLVHYKNRLIEHGVRGALFEAYEHTVAPTLIRAADRICVLSEDHARSVSYLEKALDRTPDRVVEMPNGVDTDQFSPGEGGRTGAAADTTGLRDRLGIPADAIVAAFVATLDRAHHFKRVDVAIDALATATDQRLHIVVAGGGELLDGFKARAAEAGVGDRVHFLGAVPHGELADTLRACDLFLLTTEPPESFGIVLIEAMACGLPAIATEYPGVRAIVEPGVNGELVEAGNPQAVAAALDSFAGMDPDRRHAMGAAGRAKCEHDFSWQRLLDRMDETYAGAIAARVEKTGKPTPGGAGAATPASGRGA